MFCPDGGEGSEAARSLDVTDKTDNDHWRSLDDSDSFNDFSLMKFCSWPVLLSLLAP
jgi:hypothetical protein